MIILLRNMKRNSIICFFIYIFFQTLLVAETDIKFVLPKEFLEVSKITLLLENNKIQKTVILKINNQWVYQTDDLDKIAKNPIWIIFDWDGKRHPQPLQVVDEKVLLLFDKREFEFDFKIPLDKFLAACRN
jgi:hypothetical protein